jgi:hypothetical protein
VELALWRFLAWLTERFPAPHVAPPAYAIKNDSDACREPLGLYVEDKSM